MKELITVLSLFICFVFFAGCGGARMDYTILDKEAKLGPLPSNVEIEVYTTDKPTRPYKEVAILRANKVASTAFGSVSTDDIIELLKDLARKVGCNAIINIKIEDYFGMSMNFTPTIPSKKGSGTGVVWLGPSGKGLVSDKVKQKNSKK